MSTTENVKIQHKTSAGQQQALSQSVKQALDNYFAQLDGQEPANLYQLVLDEMRLPLLEAVMQYTNQNQSKAAIIMGLSRGTLRKLLKIYNML